MLDKLKTIEQRYQEVEARPPTTTTPWPLGSTRSKRSSPR